MATPNIKVYLMIDKGVFGDSPDNFGFRAYHDGDLIDEAWGFATAADALSFVTQVHTIQTLMLDRFNKLSIEWKVLT